jgi:hypothetical protein
MEGLPARAEINVLCRRATRRRRDLKSSIRRRVRRRIIGEWVLHRQDGIFGTDKYGDHPSDLVFGGLKEVKRSFNTACRLTGIEDLHKHDLRHAFVTRSILAGIPPAVVLKASGHSSDEWKRYLNVTPDMLHDLFTPLDGQDSEAVKAYGFEVMRQLTEALMGSWKSGGNGEFYQELRARVAMPTGSGQRQAQMP